MSENTLTQPRQVIATDHGPMYGGEHWYTFSCPECGVPVSRPANASRGVCRELASFRITSFRLAQGCNALLAWKDDEAFA